MQQSTADAAPGHAVQDPRVGPGEQIGNEEESSTASKTRGHLGERAAQVGALSGDRLRERFQHLPHVPGLRSLDQTHGFARA